LPTVPLLAHRAEILTRLTLIESHGHATLLILFCFYFKISKKTHSELQAQTEQFLQRLKYSVRSDLVW